MSESPAGSTDESDETDDEHRELADYHCIERVERAPDTTYGEVERAIFDPEVIDFVYRELLDAIRSDGYELVCFGTLTTDERDHLELHERFDIAPTATFVYRGADLSE